MTDIVSQLKSLPFTLKVEQDTDGVFVQIKEFSPGYEEQATLDETLKALARSLKEWGKILGAEFEEWRKWHKEEVPALLKILVSSEDELLECLRNSRPENI